MRYSVNLRRIWYDTNDSPQVREELSEGRDSSATIEHLQSRINPAQSGDIRPKVLVIHPVIHLLVPVPHTWQQAASPLVVRTLRFSRGPPCLRVLAQPGMQGLKQERAHPVI